MGIKAYDLQSALFLRWRYPTLWGVMYYKWKSVTLTRNKMHAFLNRTDFVGDSRSHHGITEWVMLERTPGGHLDPPLLRGAVCPEPCPDGFALAFQVFTNKDKMPPLGVFASLKCFPCRWCVMPLLFCVSWQAHLSTYCTDKIIKLEEH